MASFGEKNNKRESDNGNVPLAPFSLCFLLLPPPPHHHHSLSLLALSTHCHHQPLYCFCCFKPTAPRETSRDLETQCLPACQSASANPSGEKKCAKCSDHRKLFLSGCFADLRSVMCVSAAASICDCCCCCNDDVYFEAAAATLQSA